MIGVEDLVGKSSVSAITTRGTDVSEPVPALPCSTTVYGLDIELGTKDALSQARRFSPNSCWEGPQERPPRVLRRLEAGSKRRHSSCLPLL